MKIGIDEREQRAYELFEAGANCSQAVFCAFADLVGMEHDSAMKLSSSMGGGIGRLREVCGTVSGMMLVAGALYGYSDTGDPDLKREHYRRVRALAYAFERQTGHIVCRELLGLHAGDKGGDPSPRDAAFKHARPCYGFVRTAARITAELIAADGAYTPAPADAEADAKLKEAGLTV